MNHLPTHHHSLTPFFTHSLTWRIYSQNRTLEEKIEIQETGNEKSDNYNGKHGCYQCNQKAKGDSFLKTSNGDKKSAERNT